MECFNVKNLSFTYPNGDKKALDTVNFTVSQGEFVLICGSSGCGKTTLLRLLKSSLAPAGELSGEIYFKGKALSSYSAACQASEIGFVMQKPDNQIVTDKVWHELAFGLESLGYKTPEIRSRVSEMASFFGIQQWFHNNVNELSGGQKQLLNLASIMVMQPSVLILDEPTSQLDPIAAQEFLNALRKINRELGTTVILTEHRLEEALPISDRVIVMENGTVFSDTDAREVGKVLKAVSHEMYWALPTPVRVHNEVENELSCPLTVREGRFWLEEFSKRNALNPNAIVQDIAQKENDDTVIEIKDLWFRYGKNLHDIIKGLDMCVKKGELFAIMGGNGSGKTTILSLIAGLNTPYRGEIIINGENISKIKTCGRHKISFLPQDPQSIFVKKTVYLDLMEILSESQLGKEEKNEKIYNIASLCKIEKLLERNPYDLSGGEQQRAALAKVLLTEPEILLLDEPTKGMDAQVKGQFADILAALKENDVTVVMVSHDIEFCAEYADRCALVFDGNIASQDRPRTFFGGKNFYTTAANRMARSLLPNAILAEDIVAACGGDVQKEKEKDKGFEIYKPKLEPEIHKENIKKISPARIVVGCVFFLLFVLVTLALVADITVPGIAKEGLFGMETLQIIGFAVAFLCFIPNRDVQIKETSNIKRDLKFKKRTLCAALMILLLVPFTIFVGIFFLGDRKYYFISLLIILETVASFCLAFETRKPKARELIVISVICAIATAGQSAFFMFPQFKPVMALVIIAAVCFGGETGFLVGAVTCFVSNFFLGQGPWTPWQMFAFGIVGFIGGTLFSRGIIKRSKVGLCVFGFLATLVIYGGIMNPASVIMWQHKINWEMLVSSYVMGFPFDLIHAIATAFFLWLISEPMLDKLERIKTKYGLVEK